MNKMTNCKICSKKLKGKQTLYCSTKCKNKDHQSYAAQKERGLQRKLLLVKEMGGRCSCCGYDKNLAALTFHHKDNKLFKLDVRSLSNRTYESVMMEVRKCELLCHNCHSEFHNPELDLASRSLSRLL